MHSWSPSHPCTVDQEARRNRATYIEALEHVSKLNVAFHHLPSVGSNQLCGLAYLGCTRKVGTSQCCYNAVFI